MSQPSTNNPFNETSDPDRHEIWQRLMIADTRAFVAGDFTLIETDFDAEHFEAVRCFHSADPADWRIVFADLASYRASWQKAAEEWRGRPAEETFQELLSRIRLDQIEIVGHRALAHKRFIRADRQTLYRLHKRGAGWKVVGFLGFLPLHTVDRAC